MKQPIYLLGSLLLSAALFAACDDDPKNPGDFDLKATMDLTDMRSMHNGKTYELTVKRQYDSVYHYAISENDTVFEADGKTPAVDAEGNMIINTITVMKPGIGKKSNGHIVEYEPIVIDWTRDMLTARDLLDTLAVDIHSNARWFTGAMTSTVSNASSFFSIVNGTNGGGGNSEVNIGLKLYSARQMVIEQPIITSDSSVMHILTFDVHGIQYPRN